MGSQTWLAGKDGMAGYCRHFDGYMEQGSNSPKPHFFQSAAGPTGMLLICAKIIKHPDSYAKDPVMMYENPMSESYCKMLIQISE